MRDFVRVLEKKGRGMLCWTNTQDLVTLFHNNCFYILEYIFGLVIWNIYFEIWNIYFFQILVLIVFFLFVAQQIKYFFKNKLFNFF